MGLISKTDTGLFVKKKKRKKATAIKITLFILINAVIVGCTAYNEFFVERNKSSLSEIQIKPWFLLLALCVFLLVVLSDSVRYGMMIHSNCPEILPKIMYRVAVLGRYYDNITPSGTGGQPFQIFYLQKNGVPPGIAAGIPIAAFIASQISFAILAFTVFLTNSSCVQSPAIRITAYFGIVLYLIVPTSIVFLLLRLMERRRFWSFF